MISLCVFSFISNKAKSSAHQLIKTYLLRVVHKLRNRRWGGRGSLQIMTLLDGGEGSEITVLRRGVPANVKGIPWILGEFCNCYVVMPWQFWPQTRKLWLWKYIKLLVCVLAYYQNKRYENHFLIILPVNDLCRSYVSLALVTCCIFRTSHISKPI